MTLPRAMLIDLDDTIISAYNNPRAVWVEAATELAAGLDGQAVESVVDAILDEAERFWADPEEHRIWRMNLFGARRAIVARACLRLAENGRPRLDGATGHELADR